MVLSPSFQSPWVAPPQSMTQGLPLDSSQPRDCAEWGHLPPGTHCSDLNLQSQG